MKESVKSTRSAKFYFLIFIINFMLLGMASVPLPSVIKSIISGKFEGIDSGLVMTTFLVGFDVIFNYVFVKIIPKITVSKEFIKFGHKSYEWVDIKEMKLNAQVNFQMGRYIPVEGAYFKLKNGDAWNMYDSFYGNAPEIKLFIEEYIIAKKNSNDKSSIEPTQRIGNVPSDSTINLQKKDSKKLYVFNNNQFTSFYGIMMWGFLAFLIYLNYNNPSGLTFIFTSIIGAVFFVLFSWMMYYFEVSEHLFRVNNPNAPWKADSFKFSDIKEIVFQPSIGRRPRSLAVITNDFKQETFIASTLRNQTWESLKECLKRKGIRVRDETTWTPPEEVSEIQSN